MNRFLLLFLLLALQAPAQTQLRLSDGFDCLKKENVFYPEIRKKIGSPQLVEKDSMDQWFCSMSRGQNIHLHYQYLGVNVTVRQSYAPYHGNKFPKNENDFSHCRLTGAVIAGNSTIQLNEKKIGELNAGNIESLLGKPDEKDTSHGWFFAPDSLEMPLVVQTHLPSAGTRHMEYTYTDQTTEAEFTFYFLLSGELLMVRIEHL